MEERFFRTVKLDVQAVTGAAKHCLHLLLSRMFRLHLIFKNVMIFYVKHNVSQPLELFLMILQLPGRELKIKH
jgi:hypothetical protein